MYPTHHASILSIAQRALLLLIVLWATALRWQSLDLIEYDYDEARTISMAQDVAALDGYWPVLGGGTALGIERSALNIYVLALPLLLGGQTEAAVLGTAALGVLAVLLAYRLGLRIGGHTVGLLAALYVATNPWLVHYDRKLWSHIQVLFSTGLLLLAWHAVVDEDAVWQRRARFAFPILVVLQTMSHVLAVLQALSWIGALLSAPRRWLRPATLAGIAVGLLIAAPYLWALTQQSDMGASRVTAELARADVREAGQRLLDADSWRFAHQFTTGSGISSLVEQTEMATAWWQWSRWLSWLVLALIALGAVRLLQDAARGQPTAARGARLLLAWGVGPLLVLGTQIANVYPHYWSVLLPLPALLFAIGAAWLAAWIASIPVHFAKREGATEPLQAAALAPFALALLLAVSWTGSYATALDRVAAGEGDRAFGIPLRRWAATTDAVHTWAERVGTQEVRVAVRGVDPGYSREPAVIASLIGNPPYARFVAPVDPPALLLSSDRPSLYLWTLDAPATEAQLASLGERVWSGRLANGRPPAQLYHLPPADLLALDYVSLDPEIIFDVGLSLAGYRLPTEIAAGQPTAMLLVWRVLDPPPAVRERDVTAFNHVLDEQGEMAAQIDGLSLPSRDWWPGDVLLQPYTIQLPPGSYRWRTGLYSRTDGGRAQRIDGAGDVVDLEPVVVQ